MIQNLTDSKFCRVFFRRFCKLLSLFGFGGFVTPHLRVDCTLRPLHTPKVTILVPILVEDVRLETLNNVVPLLIVITICYQIRVPWETLIISSRWITVHMNDVDAFSHYERLPHWISGYASATTS